MWIPTPGLQRLPRAHVYSSRADLRQGSRRRHLVTRRTMEARTHLVSVDRLLFIAGGETWPLLETVDAALNNVATGVDRRVRCSRSGSVSVGAEPLYTS
jgi:hypothetical protein